jgi:hypothetical protein
VTSKVRPKRLHGAEFFLRGHLRERENGFHSDTIAVPRLWATGKTDHRVCTCLAGVDKRRPYGRAGQSTMDPAS